MSNQHSFYNRRQKQLRAGFEALLGAIFLLIASGVLLRVETTSAPIYASDEYAYLKPGLVLGKPSVERPARDPGHLMTLFYDIHYNFFFFSAHDLYLPNESWI